MTDLRTTSWFLVTPLLLLAGCGSSRPSAPLTYSSFQRPDLASQVATAPVPPTPTPMHNTPPHPCPPPSSRPARRFGGYKTLGGVVSEVNGNPIYANKVLRQLTPELAARAPDMDEPQFRTLAPRK